MEQFEESNIWWPAIQAKHPEIAENILKEYQRVDGFVPYEQGYVYMMQACGTSYYKIGKTTNPDRRILQIAPQMPFTTRFIRVWRTNFMSMAESLLHKEFSQYRTNGEWFDLSPEAISDLFDIRLFEGVIRNTYGSVFWENVKPKDETYETSFSSWLFWSSQVIVGPYCNPEAIAWIEQLFCQIEEELNPVPDDIAKIARERSRYSPGGQHVTD